jgi:hypothetical protein
MKISGSEVKVTNNILSGFYGIRATGSRGRLYEFSSPSYPLSSFDVPYDAYLPNPAPTGDRVIAAANRMRQGCSFSSERSGKLYFMNDVTLIGTCHGFGHTSKTYYDGFNYYNAFYPAGYFTPPFGETHSVFKSNQDGYENLYNGNCNNINITEYNELFGIVSKSAHEIDLLSSTLAKDIYSPIYSPREACPPEVVSTNYFDEFQFNLIPGTTLALGATNHYNGNPIPTSLDSFDIKVNGRYQTTTVGKTNYIVYTGGRPQPSYSISNEGGKLNNSLCFATLLETKVSYGRGINGAQIIESPDAMYGSIGDQVSFLGADAFHNWHFTFKENAETLPFSNNFTSPTKTVSHRKVSEGTQLFMPVLSSEESFWQNRQCPDTVDFLPHTFGASIYACPSEHFDVPYYAAIRKFGFYGTRFLNTCKALDLQYGLSGVTNASELPTSASNVALADGELEPDDLDKDGSWSFAAYDNLLRVAKAEERYANMYALNKGFFIWANSGYVANNTEFQYLSGHNVAFMPIYLELVNKFARVFASGMTSFTGSEPVVLMDAAYNIIESGNSSSDLLSTNEEYLKFKARLRNVVSEGEFEKWNSVERLYGFYVSDDSGVNDNFYQTVISGREKRMRTRYFENLVRGNAIDLYPLNNITFSFDRASDYITSTGWGRKETSFGASSDLPEIPRRYFEGAYGNTSAITDLTSVLVTLADAQTDYFYPGYFQDIRYERFSPTPKYFPAYSGIIVDDVGRSFSPSGWLGLGYGEVGAYDANFSCFTPIFIQQPLPLVYTKIGQAPTMRATAVDYHTLPEDKISKRYPEIIYWARKLKMLDCNGNNLYPIRYKWYRAPKTYFDSWFSAGELLNSGEAASQTGAWGCIEGDGPECTAFHPLDSYPVYTGHQSASAYTFTKGAVKGWDDTYYYYCAVSGRFGVRISNKTELNIEDWLRFDISVKNGLNAAGSVNVGFEVTDFVGVKRTVNIPSDGDLPNYGGYQQDTSSTAESVVEQKIPPPNAGYGDVTAFRFIGPIGYIGATRTYSPSHLQDTRGLRETWGHFLDYGQLVGFSKQLSQLDGDLLYGYKHLPTCEEWAMPDGKHGVKVVITMNGNKVTHWSLEQKAVISTNMTQGIRWDRLLNAGELYPPINGRFEVPSYGIGHWQWGNNLGTIKRFGKSSTRKDVRIVGDNPSNPNKFLDEVKDKLISAGELAGDNCGYSNQGLGRNMIYYIESFERFYLICDPLKKKNAKNVSYMNPGVRMNNSSIQYFWMGRPSDTFVKRRPMYGAYAYQWRLNKHNRDRNGNGISEGFYSYGHQRKYSQLYDAPSIYGLYVKQDTSSRYQTAVNSVNEAKERIKDRLDLSHTNIRNIWFGRRGEEGTARRYGDIFYTCDALRVPYDPDICEYVGRAQALATALDFEDHNCPQDRLAQGQCFDPCMSMRYAQGFFPGGKLLDLFGFGGGTNNNDKQRKNVRIVPLASYETDGSLKIADERAATDNTLVFRSPLSTPHARITLGKKDVNGYSPNPQQVGGVTPCNGGGSDHCNYITPTIHLGVSSFLLGQGNAFSELKNYYANLYQADYNIRGEVE